MRSQIGRPFSMATTEGLGVMAYISSPLSVNISSVQKFSSTGCTGWGLSGSGSGGWGWFVFASLTNSKPCGVGFSFFGEAGREGVKDLLPFSLPLVRAEEFWVLPSDEGAGVM